MWVIICFINISNSIIIFSDDKEYIPNFTKELFLVFYILLIIFWSQQFFRYIFWHKRAKKEAELYGTFYQPKDDIAFKITILILIISIFAVWIWSIFNKFTAIFFVVVLFDVAAIIGVVLGIKALMKEIGASAKVSKIVTMIASTIISLIIMSITTFVTIMIIAILA